MGIFEQIDEKLGRHSREKVSAGVIIKAMILNGLEFVSTPLYMFSKSFEAIATEHLLDAGIKAEHLTDDQLENALDALQEKAAIPNSKFEAHNGSSC